LYAKPAPEVRKLEGDQPLDARILQVLGYTGMKWLSQKLHEAGDATIQHSGGEETIVWGNYFPLKTRVRIHDDLPILAGYSYSPGPTNRMFKRFAIEQRPTARGAMATFEKETVGSSADERYFLSVLTLQHTTPSDDTFILNEPDHSLVNSVNDPETVSRLVNGKRVVHYRPPDPNSDGGRFWPITGLALGSIAFTIFAFLLRRQSAAQGQ
jgi:hypothetical protein